MSIISDTQLPLEITVIGGKIMVIFLIIILLISFLILDTKYWNNYLSVTFDMCSRLLLTIFIAIVIYRIYG